ncbi:hypothetical protein R1sor_010707 [Riccia sorocarpa]|uniref:NADP-dependent oxidoreductase domain-containing protein n=1 Tax=Riccia sorocarpa TaxID=122646 RepID=A0ABD3I086_9MARC
MGDHLVINWQAGMAAASSSTHHHLVLNNSVKIARLGLGTFRSKGEEVKSAVLHALRSGYSQIDTASVYRNEVEIGQALKESGVARENIFLTSKVSPYEQGYDNAIEAVGQILERLGTEYLDLCLIHWPGAAKLELRSEKNKELRHETWRALERLYLEKKCRAIGVSNFTQQHLECLLSVCAVRPSVNQVEMHPYLIQKPLREYCQRNEILVQAYSPLGVGNLLADPVVCDIASLRKRTPAQILLRWGVQHNVVVLPKSVKKERIQENAAIFDFVLSDEEMDRLDGLDQSHHFCWSPNEDVDQCRPLNIHTGITLMRVV